MNSNSPENRLLDELLREQAKGPDHEFIQQIEAAVDAGPVLADKSRSRMRYGRFAIAAGVSLAAGISFFYHLQNKDAQKVVAAREQAVENKEKATQYALGLEKAIRDQEDKVEERRKVLATIVRTKGIIYKGQDSFYKPTDKDGLQSAEVARNDTREESIRRGLDAEDYVDAENDFESDQQLLQAMKDKYAALGGKSEVAKDESKREMEMEVASAPLPELAKVDDISDSQASGGGGLRARQLAMSAAPASAPVAGNAVGQMQAGGGSGIGMGRGAGMGDAAGGKAFAPPADLPDEARSGDRYGSFIEQPWKTPASNPLSTFSIDVDTASYGNVRRMIREGRTVPKDAVRIEEFINAFSYHYAQPKGDAPFAVGASIADCPWAPGHQLVRVAIKGREIDAKKRPASNLVFLIDVSGSMQSPDKLPLLKQSMATLVEQLDERDRVAIVVYAGNEGVALPSTRIDAEGRATVLKALSQLEAGGSTNGGAGINRAYQLANENKIEGGVNRVILATDGDFNVGVTGQESLVELVKDRAKGGVYLTVAGFGTGNLNDAMMDAITHDGNGNYFYIDSEREGRKVFLKNLTGTLVTIAKDVKIQVEFNPAKVGSYRLIGYANRVLKNEDFNNDKVDAGDIGAGHTVTAFYELTPPGTAGGTDELKYQSSPAKSAGSQEWLTVKLRHKHPEGDESSKIEFPLTGDVVSIDKADVDFQFATAAALMGMKLRSMDEVRDTPWEKVMELAKPGLADDASEDRAEFVELVKKLGGARERVVPAPAEVAPENRRK